MKLTIPIVALSTVSVATAHLRQANGNGNVKHNEYLHRLRQVVHPTTSTAAAAASVSVAATPVVSATPVAATGTGTTTAVVSTPVITTPTVAGTVIPPLDQITMGAAIETPLTMFTTFTAGASAPYSGAPALPTIAIIPANYPALDAVPDINSAQVKGWLAALDLSKVPNLSKTVDGSCASDPAIAADTSRCWWTCGGCTRDTDIVTCPDKKTWGVSYDDGPSPYTPKLINYLHQVNLTATFFVVGSRVISRPEMLQTEYMLGHEISVHTWSHTPLTTLSNEQIVAELGWTRQAIKDITGVSPRTMRPPYGDIDDRVRAVCAAMGLTPVIWTGSGDNEFDTDDWKIAGGTATGTTSFAAWQKIEGLVSTLNTGFIVLEHDLYQQSVDMAVGYIVPDALSKGYKMESVIECQHQSPASAYAELVNNGTSTYGSGSKTGSGSGSSSTAIGSNNAAGSVGISVGAVLTSLIGYVLML